ncbi:MAG TPA: hypothetical protein VI454_05075 [Verrucomicrobiae bacterium]
MKIATSIARISAPLFDCIDIRIEVPARLDDVIGGVLEHALADLGRCRARGGTSKGWWKFRPSA